MDRLQQKTSEAYLSHRLNQRELKKVVKSLQQPAPTEVHQCLDRFSHAKTDWHARVAGTLDEAHAFLGLDRKFDQLRQDRVWTPEQRAIYRRLSAPEHDPLLAPQGRSGSGDANFVRVALDNFAAWDVNGNGHLSAAELDAAMASGSYTGPASAALVLLRVHNPRLAGLVKDRKQGVSQADLKSFRQHGIPGQTQVTASLNRGFARLSQRAQSMKPAPPLDQENFKAGQIVQGCTASCVMLATGVGIGNLRSMFEDNQDGTVTVNFADGVRETVNDLSDAERLYHSRAGAEGRWPGLLEMAMGQRIRNSMGTIDGTIRTGANYLAPVPTMQAMTGEKAHLHDLDKITPNATRKLLARSQGPVTVGSRDGWGENDRHFSLESLHNGIENNHAYTVLKYNPAQDTVKLYNPWHSVEYNIHPDGKDDGTFTMPLLDFYSSFCWLTAGS